MASLLESLFKAPEPQSYTHILSLKRTNKPNEAMIVPHGQSAPDQAGALKLLEGRCYDLSSEDLLEKAVAYLCGAEDGKGLDSDTPGTGAALCIRTKLMRYPDMVYLHAVALQGPANSSTLGAYSHSVYGHSDLGVNLKRLETLQSALKEYEIGAKFA